MDWSTRGSIILGQDILLFKKLSRPGSGAHPASSSMGNVVFFAGVKQPGREADHSLLFRVAVRNVWRWTSSLSVGFHGVPNGYLACPLSVAGLSVCLSVGNVLHTRTQTDIKEHVLHPEKREARSIKRKAICD